MERTKIYQLCQWEAEDKVQRTDFNEDNTKIEKALAGLKADKAEQTALTALAGQVANKAEQSALEALGGQFTAFELGQLRFVHDTYTGTGEYGAEHPTRLEFDFKPLLVVVNDPSNTYYGGWPWIRGIRSGHLYLSNTGGNNAVSITWEDKAVRWYSSFNGTHASHQLNDEGTEYPYFALGIVE